MAPPPVNPGGDELAPLISNRDDHTQCVIFTPSDLFRVENVENQQLWIDNLYLRVAKNTAADEVDTMPTLLALDSPGAEVWATSMTFQSDGMACRGLALDDPTSKVYLAGAHFFQRTHPKVLLILLGNSLARALAFFSD